MTLHVPPLKTLHRRDSDCSSGGERTAGVPNPDYISPRTRESGKRGSRARRRLTSGLEVDTTFAGEGHVQDEQNFPVIDTTSADVERRPDGSVTKVNEYIIVRDLGQGSSAEVKLCRLVLPGSFGKARKGSAERAGTAMEAPTGDASPVDEVGRHSDWDTADEDFFSDLYAVKIFDRAQLMRRGARFARPWARGPGGALTARQPVVPEKFLKVQREIAIMKKLVHPNIVQLVEVIDAPMDSSLYLVMEYVERGAVMRCVESDRGRYASPATGGCLDAHTAARYFSDILAGLEFLHLNLIAHRDLKPENVLIGTDDRAKIADFGVSKYFNDDEGLTPKSPRSLAKSTSRAQMSNTEGTWCFWAPEMCGTTGDGAPFNAYAADAWAAGVTLWCLLYGALPFFSTSPMQLFTSIAGDPAPIPNGTEHSQQDLLQRILKKDAERRLTVTEARGHHWVRSKLDADAGVGTRLGWGSGSVAASSDVGTGLSMRSRGTKFDAAAATTADGSQSTLKIFKGGAPVADSSASTTAAYSSVDTIDADPMVASHGPTEKIFPGGPAKDAVAAATVAVAVAAAAPTGTASASVAGKVAISEEDVRAAVREAPGSVVLTKLKGRFHGLKDRARRLSHELGATVAVSPMPEGAGGGRRAADTVGEGGEGAGREGGDHTHNTLLSILRRRNLGESKDPKGQSVERGPRRRPTSTGCATS